MSASHRKWAYLAAFGVGLIGAMIINSAIELRSWPGIALGTLVFIVPIWIVGRAYP